MNPSASAAFHAGRSLVLSARTCVVALLAAFSIVGLCDGPAVAAERPAAGAFDNDDGLSVAILGICADDSQCNDTNPCTDDVCENPNTSQARCVYTNNTNPCDDDNACTQPDACSNGECVGSNPVVCIAPDQCHDAGTCNPATGVCINAPNKPDGTACSDNDVCTAPDTCSSGACVPGVNNVCASCGDGVIDGGETCDDSNTLGSDGCSSVCSIEDTFTCFGEPSVCTAICGDSAIRGDETCDDGNLDDGDGCDSTCQAEDGWFCIEGGPGSCTAVCSDGLRRGPEECDDWNSVPGDGCSETCTVEDGFICTGQDPDTCSPVSACGNGALDGAEECDDDNANPNDGCSDTCTIEAGFNCTGEPSVCTTTCGDGTRAGFEDCDDGNTTANDGCGTDCTVEPGWFCTGVTPDSCTTNCGDGIRAGAENCDDGNALFLDGCDPSCEPEPGWICTGVAPDTCTTTCGDGIRAGAEECDDANTTADDGCSATCTVEQGWDCTGFAPDSCTTTCGDGVRVGAEACDDGNANDGDGCSATCTVEPGWTCGGNPSVCETGCGDGIRAGAETCDDANAATGDGCDATCTIESGHTCTNAVPNVCTPICGDGLRRGAEGCDDADTSSGDGCSATCTVEAGYNCTGVAPSVCTTTCGDGIRAGDESCDDSNTNAGDGCNATCVREVGWSCTGQGSGSCSPDCGDELVVGGETCDDGASVPGDGCSATCSTEPGWTCTGGGPGSCTAICGDGLRVGPETCDDGNTIAGDGCSATCSTEFNASLFINEVHYDQASGEQEFIELFAPTSPVDLTGWTISDQDEVTYVLGRPANASFPCTGTFTLNAGDRLLISQGAGTNVCTGSSRKIFLNRGTFLQKDGDDVVLKNGAGICQDYVAFETGPSMNPPPAGCNWTGPNPNNGNVAGVSVSRFDVPFVDTDSGADWERSGASTTTGPKSPGVVNVAPPACFADADCSDGNPCTDGTCQNAGTPQAVCVQTNNTATCDDGNACTSQDICSQGTCGGTNTCAGVFLNEVHYDQGSGEQEFIELLATGGPINLTGWTLSDQDELNYVIGRPSNPSFPCTGTFSLNAGDRLVIWQGAGTSVCTGSVRQIFLDRGTFLQSAGDDLVLRNAGGVCQDYVAFETGAAVNPVPAGCAWAGPNPNNGNTVGRSISRFDVPFTDTNRGADWERSGTTTTTGPKSPGAVNVSTFIQCSSVADCSDGNPCTDAVCQNPGTPQSVCVQSNNTAACDDGNACTSQDTCSDGVCAGTNTCPAVHLTEVHYDQSSSEQEFIELLATGGAVNLTGWTISDQDEFNYVLGRPANPSFPCTGTFTLNAGDRLTIFQGAGTNVCTGTSRKIFLNRGTFLQKEGDDLVLRNNGGACQDYVAFETGASVNPAPAGCAWTGPNPTNANTVGRSISRFDNPLVDTNRGADWERSGTTTTTSPKTPGARNVP